MSFYGNNCPPFSNNGVNLLTHQNAYSSPICFLCDGEHEFKYCANFLGIANSLLNCSTFEERLDEVFISILDCFNDRTPACRPCTICRVIGHELNDCLYFQNVIDRMRQCVPVGHFMELVGYYFNDIGMKHIYQDTYCVHCGVFGHDLYCCPTIFIPKFINGQHDFYDDTMHTSIYDKPYDPSYSKDSLLWEDHAQDDQIVELLGQHIGQLKDRMEKLEGNMETILRRVKILEETMISPKIEEPVVISFPTLNLQTQEDFQPPLANFSSSILNGTESRSIDPCVPISRPIYVKTPDIWVASPNSPECNTSNIVEIWEQEVDERLIQIREKTRLKETLFSSGLRVKCGEYFRHNRRHFYDSTYTPTLKLGGVIRKIHKKSRGGTMHTCDKRGHDRRRLRFLDFWDPNRFG